MVSTSFSGGAGTLHIDIFAQTVLFCLSALSLKCKFMFDTWITRSEMIHLSGYDTVQLLSVNPELTRPDGFLSDHQLP